MATDKRAAKAERDPERALIFCLRHPLRKELLRLYINEADKLSPKELADFTKQPLSCVGWHVRVLAENKAVELVTTRPRRGAVEHFYRATPLVDEVPWARAALGLKGEPA